MKRIGLFTLLILLSFSACKKDYTCTCKDADGFNWGSFSVLHTTKKKAKVACSEHDADFSSVNATCILE